MSVYFIAFFLFVVFFALMAIGVLLGKRPISGSCGGLNVAMRDKKGTCMACGMKVDKGLQSELAKKLNISG